jgi:hypothetical protein
MEELLDAIIALRKLLSDDGRYSICRTDKYPMQLGDAMIVSDATERVDKAIEAAQQQGGQGAGFTDAQIEEMDEIAESLGDE